MKKRRVIASILTGAILGSLVLSGCSGGQEEPKETGNAAESQEDTDKKPVTLRFAWWGSQARNDQTQEVVELFEKEYPWITVECEFVGWDQYFDNLSTQIAAGDMPDILQHDYRYLETYVNKNLLLPLDEHIGKEIDLSNVDENYLTEIGRAHV